MTLTWKIGFEVELMAPRGTSRLRLAQSIARAAGGDVRRFFHPQSEPSKALGLPVFENVTPGFAAFDTAGEPIARFVDDLTLQEGLDRSASPLPGWYRIVTDDGRLLRLIMRQCDPDASLDTVLDPLARLFGVVAEPGPGGMIRVGDERGASVAIGAPLPGERERPCEIVTPPLERDHAARLGALLAAAAASGFTVPAESATHIHFDAEKLRSARAVANLVTVLSRHGDALKRHFGTNPRCVRLGPWPESLLRLVRSRGFVDLPWDEARGVLAKLPLTKYCDFNLINLVHADRSKHTFEVRILPTHLDPRPTLAAASFFEALLDWCVERSAARRMPATLAALAGALNMNLQDSAVARENARSRLNPHICNEAVLASRHISLGNIMKRTRRKVGSMAGAGIAASLALSAFTATAANAAVDQADYDAYTNSGYSYCDATLLAFAWHTSVEEAKAGIGAKVRNHWSGKDIDAAIAPGRRGHLCTFEDEGYTYEDAVALGRYWHIAPVAAKNKVDQLLTAGHRVMVPQLIKKLRGQ